MRVGTITESLFFCKNINSIKFEYIKKNIRRDISFNLLKNENIKIRKIHDGEIFYKAIVEAKNKNPYFQFVATYSKEDYQRMDLFLINDGVAGVAIKSDGNIVSLFKNPEKANQQNLKSLGGVLLEIAISNGGKKLDCYDGFLPHLYIKYGFIPSCKTKFDSNYASEKWNYQRDGAPDIVFFRHNGDSLEKIKSMQENYPKYTYYKVPYLYSYNEAAKFRDRQIENERNLNYAI